MNTASEEPVKPATLPPIHLVIPLVGGGEFRTTITGATPDSTYHMACMLRAAEGPARTAAVASEVIVYWMLPKLPPEDAERLSQLIMGERVDYIGLFRAFEEGTRGMAEEVGSGQDPQSQPNRAARRGQRRGGSRGRH